MLKTVRKTTTVSDLAIALGMLAGLAGLLVQYARMLALPTHFV